jgi:hypothetical protein
MGLQLYGIALGYRKAAYNITFIKKRLTYHLSIIKQYLMPE